MNAEAQKAAIKDAALMLLGDVGVMRKGELISELEKHMTTTERGKHFFEVREAVAELVAEEKVKLLEYTMGIGGAARKLVALPNVVF